MRVFLAAVMALGFGLLVSGAAEARLYLDANGNWTRTPPSNSYGYRIPKEKVSYDGPHKPGTIIVDTSERRLYYVLPNNKAMKYGIGVGRDGFTWTGTHRVTRKAEWPGWTPPAQMRRREAAQGRILPAYMPGGPNNPLGARAIYIGSTLYRIHGTNNARSIGQAMSSGCIRLHNDDVVDLYNRVKIGSKIVVQH